VRRVCFSAATGLVFLMTACYTGSRPPHVGSAAKDFTVQDSDHQVSLNQFRGQVVIVNFWATWCPPCQQELPSLIDMQNRLRGRGVIVLGVSIDVDGDAYHRFVKQRGVNFITVRDPERKVPDTYGTYGWPESYVIDRQGVLRRKIVGPINWDSPDVMQFLSQL
jgi:cytochrome c biogenesis protein CcmG, thiol:disulfide interchange protein DsbE